MTESVQIEAGRIGKVVYTRMAPNEDLVQGIEKVCIAQGLRHALVRSGLGSLVDACLDLPGGQRHPVMGPAVEVLSLFGEVRTQADGIDLRLGFDPETRLHMLRPTEQTQVMHD